MVSPNVIMIVAFACWLLALAVWLAELNDPSRVRAREVARRQRVEDIWG